MKKEYRIKVNEKMNITIPNVLGKDFYPREQETARIQILFDKFMRDNIQDKKTECIKKGARYAKPFGLFVNGRKDIEDIIDGIDFIFYDKNGKFLLNVFLYRENLDKEEFKLTYIGTTKKIKKYANDIAEELCTYLQNNLN